jgi:GTP cyclohydrolase III
MTTYKAKQTDTVEATQFTSELGEQARLGSSDKLDGLEYSEHSGYSFHGQRIVFGDYITGADVIARETFEAMWEPVQEAAPVPVKAAEPVAHTPRSRRTAAPEASE